MTKIFGTHLIVTRVLEDKAANFIKNFSLRRITSVKQQFWLVYSLLKRLVFGLFVCLFFCLFLCFWLSCLNCFCIIYVILHVFALTYVLRDWHFVLYFYCNLITFRNWYSIILHYFILFCVVFYHLLIQICVIIYIFLHVFS